MLYYTTLHYTILHVDIYEDLDVWELTARVRLVRSRATQYNTKS